MPGTYIRDNNTVFLTNLFNTTIHAVLIQRT